MPFPCPACQAAIPGRPRWLRRCPACGARIRGRAVEAGGGAPTYELEVAGQPETRRRLEIPWDAAQERQLARWLLWSSVITLGLVVVLYALARWAS
jgi:hypothetical protein